VTARVGFVQLRTNDPPLLIVARLAQERPNVDSGYGGWTPVTRPRRSPLTVWTAAPVLHMTLPLMLGSYAAGASVERQVGQLERMAFPTAADGTPPRLRISTTGKAIPHQERTWVIDTLTWGDATMNKQGNRTQQQVTVALMEWIEDTQLAVQSAANQQRMKAAAAKTKQGAASKRVIAKHGTHAQAAGPATRTLAAAPSSFGQGEDLLTIAARELGDASRWPEIAQLNGLRDPRSISPGQIVRLP
jgi:hypothetical protein